MKGVSTNNKNDTSYPSIKANWEEFCQRTEQTRKNILSNLLFPIVQSRLMRDAKDEKSRKSAHSIAKQIIEDTKLVKEAVIAVFEKEEAMKDRYTKLDQSRIRK